MTEKIKAQRGTTDILPAETFRWRYAERIFGEVAASFGFNEIRTPTFEATGLFARGVGDSTDVVQKEMYTFEDKSNRSITLKPEGTAGVVRAVLEHSLLSAALPLKLYYATPCFRYEKPQAGRLREFHQFGVEIFGSAHPYSDVKLIDFTGKFFEALGINGLSLEINSVGCPKCRPKYHAELKSYFQSVKDNLCQTCHLRLDTNPMRVFDCKSEVCADIAKSAPVMLDFLCDECKDHFSQVEAGLKELNISYSVNSKIVRGLDYYTKTVFEFITDKIGAQGTVCGGGRYDGLVETLGGPPVPGLGFGLGIERLLLLMEKSEIEIPLPSPCMLYICNAGENARIMALRLTAGLNAAGIYCECDEMERSLKAQMKYADKLGAQYTTVIGDDEINCGIIKIKNMSSGEIEDTEIARLKEYFDKV